MLMVKKDILIAPEGLEVGMEVFLVKKRQLILGNTLPLSEFL